jgi:uncharacterized damage-inducible protein DinB
MDAGPGKQPMSAARQEEARSKMDKFFRDYMDRLEELHREISQSITGLSQEALDWVPGRKMNSMAVLVAHLVGAERYWVGDVAGGERSGRVRSEEFQVRGLSSRVLIERLEQSEAYTRGVLECLNVEDLNQHRSSPRDDQTFTLGWALLHALEHTAIHLGHIQIVRQLWEQVQEEGRM